MKKHVRFSLSMNKYWGAKPHSVIAADENYDLCFLPAISPGADEEYWLLSETAKVVLGYTGLVQSIQVRVNDNIETTLNRSSAYGNFQPADEKHIRRELNSTYKKIKRLDFDSKAIKRLFNWNVRSVLSRFKDFTKNYSNSDIIPGYNDKMIVVKVSEGCPRQCVYCPEPNSEGINLLSMEEIKDNMAQARRIQSKYHGEFMDRMTEGFLNTSDILWFPILGKQDVSDIISRFYRTFPETRKLSTFMGVPNINKTSKEDLARYFNNAQGINRVLVGLESGHDETSRFLGKNETAEDKRNAIKRLENIGYKVKMIVQVGTVGQGFYDESGNFISGREGLESTIDLLSSVMGLNSRNKVLVSKYVPIEGTPLVEEYNLIQERVVPFDSNDELNDELRWFTKKLAKKGISHDILEKDYESALEGRVRTY